MTEEKDKEKKSKVLSLGERPMLGLKKTVAPSGNTGTVRQSFSHGRSKAVVVEAKRSMKKADDADKKVTVVRKGGSPAGVTLQTLTEQEKEARARALRGVAAEPARAETEYFKAEIVKHDISEEKSGVLSRDALRQKELEEMRRIQEQERAENDRRQQETEIRQRETRGKESGSSEERKTRSGGAMRGVELGGGASKPGAKGSAGRSGRGYAGGDDDEGGGKAGRNSMVMRRGGRSDKRTGNKMNLSYALSGGDEEGNVRRRSVASMRRRAERQRREAMEQKQEAVKVTRDVILPEAITVQELANRMAERGADVIKVLMKLGVMAAINNTIDADTAELVATEMGHRVKRVQESDIEAGIMGVEDTPETLKPRAPVVTVMGHVDHGKTSLLDALREAKVAAGEAGGITQHIGAYQIILPKKLYGFDSATFIDTPGHAAFTEMRSRGAQITDIVVLIVAADDGIMPQTVEAIKHAKAAKVPIIVAINKCDLPTANPDRVRQELLQHDIQVEEMGGEVLCVEISAKARKGLDKLIDAILLQAEILDLKANPNRAAEGSVIESKLEKGRGPVATVLVRRGSLRVGDIFVAGSEWGKVRALITDRGQSVLEALPSMPVEVLGLNSTPMAGDELLVVSDEAKAREIAEYRSRRKKAITVAASTPRGNFEQMMQNIKAGAVKELAVLVKGDVHGSVEAIKNVLLKIAGDNTEVRVNVLDAAVGSITESDVTLSRASHALIIGFNVRANAQARELAKRDGVEIRYYSVIYNVIDDVKQALSGLLSPELREKFIGNAQILQVFNISKVGKVAGCKVVEGIVKRGAKVRLLRDNIVIHEGVLRTLKRMKDEVKEVREGFECGMAFENYDDIKENDIIECFEVEEIARSL
ncbi:MAG: translation initiation factor IF-2 [Alphaproteobacteria bacterium]|nr:translation initiation factor IF-2 [Alphaproteobacteria bacterium]MCL2505414.1 translation initiation factor IF-2 [Alphaproteobacteria bacterium]